MILDRRPGARRGRPGAGGSCWIDPGRPERARFAIHPLLRWQGVGGRGGSGWVIDDFGVGCATGLAATASNPSTPKKIDLGLERIGRVLDRLSLRKPPYRKIAIGGTNGKGSCVALLESLYLAGGYSVGAFTSPHLWRFNERIRVDGAETDSETIVSLFECIDRVRGGITLTYFEFSAVAALLHFARSGVDVAPAGSGTRRDGSTRLNACRCRGQPDRQHRCGSPGMARHDPRSGRLREGRNHAPRVPGDRCRAQSPAEPADHTPPVSTVDLRRLGSEF